MKSKILHDTLKKKAENREVLRKQVLTETIDILKLLSQETLFEKAYIFGSLSNPFDFRENSDVDIAFQGLDKDNLFYVTGFLSSHLERDVNVVHIEDVHFRDKIIREGIPWTKE
jgi:predicted nucleotidyltransferase